MTGEPNSRVPPGAWWGSSPFLLFLVFALAFSLRASGVPFGEPFPIHTDEPAFVRRALRVLTTGDLNPHWFGHPGTFTIYNLAALYALKAWAAGVPFSVLLDHYADNPDPFHALGKHLVIFWSLLGHLGIWLLTLQFATRSTALLAVVFFAVARIDIEVASLIRTDTQQSTLLIFLCWCLCQGVRTRKARWFFGASALLGLATATKWPSAVASLPILLAVFLSGQRRPTFHFEWRRLGLAVAAGSSSLIAFSLSAPYAVLDFATVLEDVRREAIPYHLGATSSGFFPTVGFYFSILESSLTLLVLGLGALGVVATVRVQRAALIPLSLFVVYLVFISSLNLRFDRWAVPLVPPVCLFAALGVKVVWDLAGVRNGPKIQKFLVAPLMAVALLLSVAPTALATLEKHARPNQGVLATRWIAENLPSGSRVLTEWYAPLLPRGGQFEVFEVSRRTGRLTRVPARAHHLENRGHVGSLRAPKAELEKLDYVLMGPYQKRLRVEASRHRAMIKVYDQVERETRLVKKFGSLQIREVRKKKPAE